MLLKRSLRQPSRPKAISRIVSLVLAGGFLYLLVSTRIPVSQAEPTPFLKPESASLLPQDPPSLQTLRNVGKAYYEQGKYDEAIARFEKITALGRSKAEDHLNLGLALMQNQQLDAAMGELTTARRMAPRSTAVLYNLGILHKRLLRYPDAEALLQQVVEADPEDPAAWFNLAKVRFDQRKLPEALESYSRVVNMGFGKGQNFYVASLFHSFTALMRLKRREEAMKLFQTHQSVKDKVPSIALQMPALEGGRYGAIHRSPARTGGSLLAKRAPNPGFYRCHGTNDNFSVGDIVGRQFLSDSRNFKRQRNSGLAGQANRHIMATLHRRGGFRLRHPSRPVPSKPCGPQPAFPE